MVFCLFQNILKRRNGSKGVLLAQWIDCRVTVPSKYWTGLSSHCWLAKWPYPLTSVLLPYQLIQVISTHLLLSTVRPVFQSRPVFIIQWTYKPTCPRPVLEWARYCQLCPCFSWSLQRIQGFICMWHLTSTFSCLERQLYFTLLTWEESEMFYCWGYWEEFSMPQLFF